MGISKNILVVTLPVIAMPAFSLLNTLPSTKLTPPIQNSAHNYEASPSLEASSSNTGNSQNQTEPSSLNAQAAEAFFPAYQAVYSTIWKKGISFKVEGEQTLTQKAKNTWQFEFSVDTLLATLNESVSFTTENYEIRPLNYSYRSSILGKKRDAKLTFDWDKMTVLNDVKNKPWRMKITDTTIDRLGLQLQLRYDLLNEISDLEYDVADGGKIKHFVFERQQTEQINTKLGKLDAIKVARTDNLSDKRHSYFWFAPQYDYLLVRMEHFEKGESYTLDLEKITENIAHK